MAENNSRPSGANKYSVYAQQEVDSTQVNWGKIAGDLTRGAEAIRDERQGRKDAIDEATVNAMDQLSQIEGTDNADAASLLINGSNMSVQALKEQVNLLRRGLAGPNGEKNYKLFMTEQKNGYKNLSTAVKAWDSWATEAKDRLQAAKDGGVQGGGLEVFINLQTEALGNLKNKKLWSNPTNGKMSLVTMRKNPETGRFDVMPDYKTQPENYQNPNTMNSLMKYQQDRIDVDDMATAQTKQIGQIIQSFVSGPAYSVLKGNGAVKTVEDFRNFGNFGKKSDGTSMTYDDWKTAQINAMVGSDKDLSNENAGQVLFNGGGYKYAKSLKQFEEMNPGLGKEFWIKTDSTSGRPVITLNDSQMTEARRLADIAIETQVSHIEKLTQSKSGQQLQQPNPANASLAAAKKRRAGYFTDVNGVITAGAGTASSIGEDRLLDMNQQFLNSKNTKDANTVINQIERTPTEIGIYKTVNGKKVPVIIQKYEMTTENGVKVPDLTKPLSSKDIARKVYREIIPRAEVKNMPFDQFYEEALANGNDFTPRMIKDSNGKMIKNDKFKGDEITSTTTTFTAFDGYDSANASTDGKVGGNTIASNFGVLSGNEEKAAPVVLSAFKRGLRKIERDYGSNLGIKVSTLDVSGPTNEITVQYKDPITGVAESKTFYYDDDNVLLQTEVDNHINSIIDGYNKSKSGSSRGGAGLGRTNAPPSDIRLKENIKLIGKSESGINIYSWNYKPGIYEEGIFTGVMAQEVPWATVPVGDYLHVDYSKVDVEFNKIG